MVARIHAGGKSFGGLVSYLTHDKTEEDGKQPETRGRVGFVDVENLVTRDPLAAARVMAGTAYDAPALKRLSGESAKGRKLTKPVYHYSLNWSADEPRPDRAEMREAVQTSLDDLGMAGRQALMVEHTDTSHPHVHVVVNRVDPETGRAASTSHDARKLSTWARIWEQDHGGIRVSRYADVHVEDGRTGLRCGPTGSPAPVRGVRPGRRELTDEEKRQWRTLRSRQRVELAAAVPAERKDVCERQSLERAKLSRDFNILARQDEETRAVEVPATKPAEVDDQQHRLVELERQRAAAREEEQREAAAARERRIEALASFPGAHAAAHEQLDRLEPGSRESGLSAETFDQVLDDVEGAIDKSLDKQEAELKARLRDWDDRGQDLLVRARTDVLGSGQAQPADRQERAQVLDAADRLDVAERAIEGARLDVEERLGITPSHRSLQAAAVEVAQAPRTSQWGRDIAGAIDTGNARPGYDDPGLDGETEQIRARIRTRDEEAAAEAAKAAAQAADQEHAQAVKTWEQLSLFRRMINPQPERKKPKAPAPGPPLPMPERIESYRDAIARFAVRAISVVIRHFQPELDPERRSRIPDLAPPAPEPERNRRNRDRGGGMEL